MSLHIFPLRHHSPILAKYLHRELDILKPDYILLEGIVEADELIKDFGIDDLELPVAITAYNPDKLEEIVFLPFAEFSPEWIALKYAKTNSIPLRFMDLPVGFRRDFSQESEESEEKDEKEKDNSELQLNKEIEVKKKMEKLEFDMASDIESEFWQSRLITDPLSYIAKLSGYTDLDAWWDSIIDDDGQIFNTIRDLMQELREAKKHDDVAIESIRNDEREVYMRKIIREVISNIDSNCENKENKEPKIAIICGAWHSSQLTIQKLDENLENDTKIINQLPKLTHFKSTWIPWSNDRLTFISGYGAGITSPIWYNLLFKNNSKLEHNKPQYKWLRQVAKLLRDNGLDFSPAHLIDTYNSAKNLSIIRNKKEVGLEDMLDAVLTVTGHDGVSKLNLIYNKLFIGDKIGKVGLSFPTIPLENDIKQQLKNHRLLPTDTKPIKKELDLRKDTDLQKSILLHRINLLEIENFATQKTPQNSAGSSKEYWTIQNDPSFEINIIKKSSWGSTLIDACLNYQKHLITQRLSRQNIIIELANLLPDFLQADLEYTTLIVNISSLAVSDVDLLHIIKTLAPLLQARSYGNARNYKLDSLDNLISSLSIRIWLNLPSVSRYIPDDESNEWIQTLDLLLIRLRQVDDVIDSTEQINQCLVQMCQSADIHPLLEGWSLRLARDRELLSEDDFQLAISKGTNPSRSTYTISSFLKGLIGNKAYNLIHNQKLMLCISNWLDTLREDIFLQQLPYLRSITSNFNQYETSHIKMLVTSHLSLESKSTQTLELEVVKAVETQDTSVNSVLNDFF
jgi:Family of unknown function (DUF5682)